MKKIIRPWIVCVLLLAGTGAMAQVPAGLSWHLVKEGSGIEVYTAPVSGSARKYIRVRANLEGSVREVEQVFRDIGRQPDWVYATRRAYLVRQQDDDHLEYYNQTALPWPASNRDVVIRMGLREDASQRSLLITQEAEPSSLAAHRGVVRVTHLWGQWSFREVSPGKLQAEYYLDVDPAGSLPVWLVNLFIARGPYETFVNLRALVEAREASR